MATKLNKKILLVALVGAFGLVGCNDEIKSYPKTGTILQPSQGQDIYNNELESIYEKIRSGSLASDVLEKLLYEYANSIFGRFSVDSPRYVSESTELTLSEAYAKTRDNAERREFIKKHKAYWAGENEPSTDADWKSANDKLDAIFESIEGRIAENLYNKISGGSYSKHNIFSEKDFLASLYFDGKSVTAYNTPALDTYEGILDPEVKAKDAFITDLGIGFLHKDYYYSENNHYAVKEFIETIYKELLIEQYILDESYSTLGRSYARKVNVLSISVDDDNKSDVPALVDYLINKVIAAKEGANRLSFNEASDRRGELAVKSIFDSVSDIMRGLPATFTGADNLAKTIVSDLYTTYGLYGDIANFTTDPDHAYLTSTEYGSMMKELDKIDENLALTDSSVESSYTGSGEYTIAVGKGYKETEIALKNYVSNGWYIKNGGLSSLPDSIRSRLFNISVANALDVSEGGLVDRTDANWSYDEEAKTSKFVAKVNGAYFLKAETVEDKNSNKDLYFYDSSSSTYYFVQIIEAVNPAKLSTDSTTYGDLKEDIARDVVEIVGEISSYSTLSKEHWLEKMTLEYHDQVVYDYFKTNYPDLFED